jgi:hypothetical protein
MNLKLHKFKDKQPNDRSLIYLFDPEQIDAQLSIELAEVDIFWFEYDSNDNFTGSQIIYSNEAFLDNFVDEDGSIYTYKKTHTANGYEFKDEQVWCYQKDILNLIKTNNE